MVRVAVEALHQQDMDKLELGLSRLYQADPAVEVRHCLSFWLHVDGLCLTNVQHSSSMIRTYSGFPDNSNEIRQGDCTILVICHLIVVACMGTTVVVLGLWSLSTGVAAFTSN